MADFFISYTAADANWAEWIAWTLEEAGYKVTIQKWDFRGGNNFVLEMHRATAAQRTIVVLSPDYQKSSFAAPEWAAAFAQDPEGIKRTLLPVRVRQCAVEGLLKPVVYINLVGLDEDAAQRELLAGLKLTRGKPSKKPAFPGTKGEAKPFPGERRGDETADTKSRIPKIRRAATDLDKRRFMKESFDTIRDRFRELLGEMARHNAGVEFNLTEVDATKFTAEVFVDGESRARCKIWQGGIGGDGISYAEGHLWHGDNSCNEMLTLADGGELALRAMTDMGLGRAGEGLDTARLSPEDAATYLWRRFMWAFER